MSASQELQRGWEDHNKTGKPADYSLMAGKVLQGLILKTDTMTLEFILLSFFFFFNQEHVFHITDCISK